MSMEGVYVIPEDTDWPEGDVSRTIKAGIYIVEKDDSGKLALYDWPSVNRGGSLTAEDVEKQAKANTVPFNPRAEDLRAEFERFFSEKERALKNLVCEGFVSTDTLSEWNAKGWYGLPADKPTATD